MRKQDLDILRPLFQITKPNAQLTSTDVLGHQIQRLGSILTNFNDALSTKMKEVTDAIDNSRKQLNGGEFQHQTQPRFREIVVKSQSIIGKNAADRLKCIKTYASDVARIVLTKSFKQFQQQKITQVKLRHFFCNNFIYNIIRYSLQNNLSKQQLQQMDDHLKQKVFSFLQEKYPQNQSSQRNQKLDEKIKIVDNFDSNQNDLIYQSNVKFQYKKSGDYSKEIMQFINYLLKLTRDGNANANGSKNQSNQNSLFDRFYQQMQGIFEKVFNEQWMVRAAHGQFDSQNQNAPKNKSLQSIEQDKNGQIIQKQAKKQKYKKIVKQYTKYVIGKKISDNVKIFDEEDISEQNLKIHNPGIMRILAKWCEQLEKCFQQININSRTERFRMADGGERNLKKDQREELYVQLCNSRQKNLAPFIKDTMDNFYDNQHHLLKKPILLQSFRQFASQNEGVTGYFATAMSKSYKNYLISYLNKLIHCILSAQQDLKDKLNKKQQYKVSVNLISFKIGDLLRCKCSSKETEIIALYQYLQSYCTKNPQKLQIVRVKNRLSDSTKDILINLKFQRTIMVQMQLSINEETSKFIKCSSLVKHFLYELERARFGPMSQICNIYSIVDPRAQFFKKKFNQLNDHSKYKQINIGNCSHKPAEISLPIWCDQCQSFTSNLNLLSKHKKCDKCSYAICGRCVIRSNEQKQKKRNRITLNYQNIINTKGNYIKKKISVLDIQRKIYNQAIFYLVYYNFKIIFFQFIDPKKVKYIAQAKNQKQLKEFLASKQILSEEAVSQKEEQEIKGLINNQILRKFISTVKKRARKHFVFEQLKVDESIFTEQSLELVEQVLMNRLTINSTKSLVHAFPKAKIIVINKNRIKKLQDLDKWQYAKQLSMQGNQIEAIPPEIKQMKNLSFIVLSKNKFTHFPEQLCEIENLQSLNIKQNKMQNISPHIAKMQKLKHLRLNNNEIRKIPAQIEGAVSLTQIDLSDNKIQSLPPQFKQLKNLTKVIFQKNQIQNLPDDIFERMPNLTKIDFTNNRLQNIPNLLYLNNKLATIDFTHNNIEHLPIFIFNMQNLQELILSENRLRQINIQKTQKQRKLKKFSVDNNELSSIPVQLFEIQSLQKLKIGGNKLKQIPSQIQNLQNIKQLSLQNMQLAHFPELLLQFPKLQQLNLSRNALSSLPPGIQNLRESLRQLNLSNNHYTQLPQALFCLHKLEQLNVNANRICCVPIEIQRLQKLQKFWIQDNFVEDVGYVIAKLPFLEELHIKNNKISYQTVKKINKNARLRIFGIHQNVADLSKNSKAAQL